MSFPVRRSLLFAPGDTFTWTSSSGSARPDGLVLDFTTLVHPDARSTARGRAQELVNAASKETAVWAQTAPLELARGLEAAVWPGLAGVVLSGAEKAEDVAQVDEALSGLESQRGVPSGSVKILLLLDSGPGLWNQMTLASASSRVDGLIFGAGDQLYELTGTEESLPIYSEPTPRFPKPEYVWGRFISLAAMSGLQPLCTLGTSVAPGHADIPHLTQGAQRARALGFQGGVLLDPAGVETANRCFTLVQESISWAQSTVQWEQSSQGTDVVVGSHGGPLSNSAVRRARAVLERAEAARS